MDKAAKIEAYFEKNGPFREGLALLREIVLKAEVEETLKWGSPVYTHNNQNVLGVMAFKQHFGLWFFNGVFLSDPLGVLENAQEGKTKAMRHWKFTSAAEIDPRAVQAYVAEAVENARKGMKLDPSPRKSLVIPEALKTALKADPTLEKAFQALAPYKQKDFAEYIGTAKREATREQRMAKILPMIREGIGLNDKYRKC